MLFFLLFITEVLIFTRFITILYHQLRLVDLGLGALFATPTLSVSGQQLFIAAHGGVLVALSLPGLDELWRTSLTKGAANCKLATSPCFPVTAHQQVWVSISFRQT